MNPVDQQLEKLGLKYEDLNFLEKETVKERLEALSKSQITVEGIRDHISQMKDAVELELSKTDHNTKQDIYLKARLRNYILLQSFLSTPERMKRALENMTSGIVK